MTEAQFWAIAESAEITCEQYCYICDKIAEIRVNDYHLENVDWNELLKETKQYA